ncbi:sucrase ferredoxin [Frankia sp. Cppng1_Ct_nod]|uniref:sucrase ferredoxin n=1 Tax=Frankia sp. Cppng1_Ct_nod TaxID=2897162 RepID=UPI0010418AE4|nr:sucrase ferredoxin [Frankia sp. Cppng1_Ct_nod]
MSVGTTSPALSYRCAPWTQEQGVDPIGSALTCDTFVLVEIPPPWPHDVSEIPAFAEVMRRGLRRTRLLAAAPADDPGGDPAGRPADRLDPRAGVLVTLWCRQASNRFRGTDHMVPHDRLAEGLVRLLSGVDALGMNDRGVDALSVDDLGMSTAARTAPAEVLLCGHGVRDRCCGREGVRLQLEVASAWPGVRVRRCSHTGGHRFAPTGFTLPDGRAWGFLDAAALDGIIGRGGRPTDLRGRYRGTTALDRWGQVVERELFERFGWGWLDHELISARTEVADGGRTATVELAWQGPAGSGTATASVEVVRDVPVLVCGEPPELAEKTNPELALRSITISSDREQGARV